MAINNGRDQSAPTIVVKEGREWRSQAFYTSYTSDGLTGTRLTQTHRRPVRRKR